MPEEDLALQEPSSGTPNTTSLSPPENLLSASAAKTEPGAEHKSFYDSALATKLASENDSREDGNPLLSASPATSSAPVAVGAIAAAEANDSEENSLPWYKRKCGVISILVVLAIAIAVAVVVPLVLSQTNAGGDENDDVNDVGATAGAVESTTRNNPEREAAIAERLIPITPGGNETLMDPNTSQYRSWMWLVYDDEMKLDPTADHLEQRYLLMVIYFPSLLDVSGASLQWGSAVHECEWESVQCQDKLNLINEYGQDEIAKVDDNPQRVVTGLDMRQRLGGQIPEELSMLPFLQYLNLKNNKLVGSLPPNIYELRNLNTLILSQNVLSNVDAIGEFKHLEHLYLSMNRFNGALPSSFQNLKHLKTLDLHSNEFTGDLFEVIDDFESLEVIDVAFNDFIGTISPLIGNMTNLTTLLLGNNQFSGDIPEEIQFCTKLQDLSVEANHNMGGIIPAVIGQLTSLVYINLSTCGFRGPLPASLGNLKQLTFLDVSFNSLSGALPTKLGSATNLTKLVLAYNEFEGSVPAEYGLLTNLQELYLQNNNLVGDMPNEICTLRQQGTLQSITASCESIACTCCDGRYCN